MHERIGERRLSNRFGWMQVVKWEGNKKVTVKFDDHPNEVVCQWNNFIDGFVTAYPHKPKTIIHNLSLLLVNMVPEKEKVSISSTVNCYCKLCKVTIPRSGSSLLNNPYCIPCAEENKRFAMLSRIAEKYKYKDWCSCATSIIFNCIVHGEYSKYLRVATEDASCPKCKSEIAFVQAKLKNISDSTLLSVPTTRYEKVDVTCNLCGDNYSANILTLSKQGRGCKKCRYSKGNVQRITFDVFVERAKVIEGYTYNETTWKSIADNLDITHLDCGRTFSQQASTHISGNYGKPVGCPYCATHGFSLGRNGSIYVLYEETLGLTKVGVTHQPVHRRVMQIRANSLRKYNVDINFKLLQSWEMSGEECIRVEKAAHKYLSERFESPAINFDGSTECFKCSPENAINFIKNF